MIKDVLAKREENLSITICVNGYMVECGGRDGNDDWLNAKVLCATFNDLVNTIAEFESLPKA